MLDFRWLREVFISLISPRPASHFNVTPSPEQLPRRPPLLRHPTKAHSSPNVGEGAADRQGPGKSCCFYLPLKEAQVRRISLRPTKPPLICARQSSVFPLAFIRWASFTLPIRIEQKSPGKKKKKENSPSAVRDPPATICNFGDDCVFLLSGETAASVLCEKSQRA